jgi:hypothetical protein
MTEPNPAQVSVEPLGPREPSFIRRKLPYVAVLMLTMFGVAYTSMAQQPLVFYWEFLAVLVGILCVTTGWPRVPDKEGRFRLIWTQAAHWAAILVAMNVVLLPSVQRMLTAPATGLAILLLLALGTFLAGIQTSVQICLLGLVMALAVPAVVWLKQSILFIVLGAAAILALGVMFWRR